MQRTTTATKEAALRLVPQLRGMDEREIAKLARLVDDVRVEAGRVLMREGEVGRQAFVIADGVAKVTIAGEDVCQLGPGEIVGEMAMVLHRPRTATVVATTPMRLLAIGPADFHAFAGLPPVARAVTTTLVTRLVAADERIRVLANGEPQ